MEQPNNSSTEILSQNDEALDHEMDRAKRRVKQGRVASNKMDKTIVVVAETRVPHSVYGKIVRKSTRFKAHDERNEANIGDVVRIAECRPLSREKRWRLVEIVERAK
ncbi:MAG TPA: 30S ribosomal protein S17 [Candidatus Acidoferrum sp.]|jgi:small subunit ribosomal protein S17|nr:30S ribosomal protein S17 [Candidatus Acidoferrum sp.]